MIQYRAASPPRPWAAYDASRMSYILQMRQGREAAASAWARSRLVPNPELVVRYQVPGLGQGEMLQCTITINYL